jgi:hypothetical protein
MASRRLISLVLLIAAGVSFGGVGQFVHERVESAALAHHEGINTRDSQAGHDAEHCAVCHLLAAARIDRVAGPTICVAMIDSPPKSRARDEATPCRFHVQSSLDARGPPRGPCA